MKKLQIKKDGKWIDPPKREATGVLKELLDEHYKDNETLRKREEDNSEVET